MRELPEDEGERAAWVAEARSWAMARSEPWSGVLMMEIDRLTAELEEADVAQAWREGFARGFSACESAGLRCPHGHLDCSAHLFCQLR